MSGPLLSLQRLEYRYPDQLLALRGLDLTIERGRKLALLGSNGSGKTTLLLHLNGTLRPTHGTVLLDGQPVRYDRQGLNQWRRRVGLVLQEPDDQLFAATVEQDVSFGPLNLGLSEAEARFRVHEALEALRITSLATRATHTLSFGQKKRVAIAGVLAMRPELLVLDEPTAGLDSHGVTHLLGALQGLHQAGTTLVFSTHDTELAYSWADRVAVLNEGQLSDQGETTAVLDNRALLARAHLKPPLLLELAQALGAGRNGVPLPRTRATLLTLLRERLPGSDPSIPDIAFPDDL